MPDPTHVPPEDAVHHIVEDLKSRDVDDAKADLGQQGGEGGGGGVEGCSLESDFKI